MYTNLNWLSVLSLLKFYTFEKSEEYEICDSAADK